MSVEDDVAIRRGIADALAYAGYAVGEAGDAASGLALAVAEHYDLVLLDLILPDGDGLDALRQLRRIRPMQPVIILTARGDEDDRVRGLRLGADDYVVKPFSAKELLARVEAVLRRCPPRGAAPERLEIPGGVVLLDQAAIQFHSGGRQRLSEKEVELLRYLAGQAGRAVSRGELLERVWELDPRGISTRTIDMHVTRLREKLRDDPRCPRIVVTVRGAGYLYAGVGSNRP